MLIKSDNFVVLYYYFLLILIILAGGILFKKYTNIYEGYTEDEVEKINTKVTSITEFVNTENTKMENEMKKLKKDDYDKMVETTKKHLDLKIKYAIWNQSKIEDLEKAYKEKELYDKVTSVVVV